MIISSVPTGNATGDTLLGYLAFLIWVDIRSGVILFSCRVQPFGVGKVTHQLCFHIW